jgi:AAA domain
MKLSDMQANEYIKVLVVGPPGTTKTCFGVGFPYPILALDFDNKMNSAAAWYSGDRERLENVEVKNLAKKLDGSDPIAELLTIITELGQQQKEGKMKFKTLLIDSATTFSAAVLQHIIKTNPGVKRVASAQGVQPTMSDYGILRREFARLVPGLLSLPMNIVMTAHIKTDRSDLTGEILRTPLMDGSFGAELPIYFEEVYRTYMKDGKPYAQTKSDMYYEFCRSQIPRVPNPVELKYENLIKKY